ncbi:unnamed protein product, partial [Ectocarpus fasciculatus]
ANLNSEAFLVHHEVLSDYRYEHTMRELSLQERLAHLLDRATLQGQRRELQNLICPSNLVIPRELLRTVPCKGGDNGLWLAFILF